MKKYTLPFLFLCACLFTACSTNNKTPIQGEIIEEAIENDTGVTSFVVQTKNEGKVGVFLTADSFIHPMIEGITEEDFRQKAFDDIVVSVEKERKKPQSMITKEKEEIPTYTATRVFIEEMRIPNNISLKDGTEVEAWQTRNGVSYRFPDGIHLFEEWTPSKNPAYVSVFGQEEFASLTPAVQNKISAFYEKQAIPYKLSEELEKAYAVYASCKNKADFKTQGVEYSVYPTASSDKVLYYATNLSTLLFHDNRNNSRATITSTLERSAAFDRETGTYIEPWNLFSSDKKTVISTILDSLNLSDTQQAEIKAAFDWTYIHFSDEYLSIHFPAGTLPNQKERYCIDIPYKHLDEDIVHSWAIPKAKILP